MLDTINEYESNVRGYVRLFPTVFDTARGSELWDHTGRRFLDFFCGAGTLNYGHNNPIAKRALVHYIERDGIQHGLDVATVAKIEFIETFVEQILRPRGLDYKIQFTGPTGTNSVEAALKLARKATGRSHVIAFTHAYHGHSIGSLNMTANSYYHHPTYSRRHDVTHMPFDGYFEGLDSTKLLDQMLSDSSSGIPIPAAVIIETVQGEGGVNVAGAEWLRSLAAVCRKHSVLLIVDDIQVGNGRAGTFFSFERAGIAPDLVCMSKSVGGGLPISFLLIRPGIDLWKPGEHTGTFRGNNLAFVVAAALIKNYWSNDLLVEQVAAKSKLLVAGIEAILRRIGNPAFSARGCGMIQGIDLGDPNLARRVIDTCFNQGLIIEACGARDEVIKLMPALTTADDLLLEGLGIIEASLRSELGLPTLVTAGEPSQEACVLSVNSAIDPQGPRG